MKTTLSKHKAKAKKIEYIMRTIEHRHPEIDFNNERLKHDISDYFKLKQQLKDEQDDIICCVSDNPDMMCSDCNCWKKTRAMCG